MPIPSPFPVVCTSAWTPMVFTDGKNQDLWSGYAIDLFRGVAAKLDWDPSTWRFETLDWGQMEKMLDKGECSIASAGIDVTVENVQRGWLNTIPIYTRAYSILTTLTIEKDQLFGFLSPFTFELWIAVLASSLMTAALVWFAEAWGHRSAHAPKRLTAEEKKDKMRKPKPSKTASVIHRETIASQGAVAGSFDYFYKVIGKALNVVDGIPVQTVVSKFLLLFWGLAMVVVLATYSASLTANLTVSRVKGGVNSIADLPGKAVGTWEPYVADLKQYNVFSTSYAWDNTDDEKLMVADLLAKKVVAFVLDNVFVRYLAQNSDCKLQQVGTDFEYIDMAITFPAGTDPAVVKQFNDALVALKQEGLHEILEKRYMGRDNRCLSSGLKDANTAITFNALKGLWVIGAGWYGFSLLMLLGITIYHRKRATSMVGVEGGASLIIKTDLHSIEVMSEVADSRAPSVVVTNFTRCYRQSNTTPLYSGGVSAFAVNANARVSANPSAKHVTMADEHQAQMAQAQAQNGSVYAAPTTALPPTDEECEAVPAQTQPQRSVISLTTMVPGVHGSGTGSAPRSGHESPV